MQYQSIYSFIGALVLSSSLFISGCGGGEAGANTADVKPADTRAPVMTAEEIAKLGDVIARVGDQAITFNLVNTMLNSSAVVGVSVPALGTPERDTARIVVLDKVVSANLLYLDALRLGLDKDPVYVRAMQEFSDGMLGSQYYRNVVSGDIPVTEMEIQAFYDKMMKPGTEMTDELRTQIEAALRKRKLQQRVAAQREELRQGIEVEVYPDKLAAEEDEAPSDDAPVAKYGDKVISWGDVKATLLAAGRGAAELDPTAMEVDAQLDALQMVIDKRIMAERGREAGLEADPMYRTRMSEYKKTRLVNLHRARLAQQMEPTEEELAAYYEANRNRIMQVEMRKLQEVLVKDNEQAQQLKAKIEAGEITMFQAAADHSVAPGAKQHLGEVGWVAQGRAQPALDEIIFGLEPGEVGGPVESTEGWHLFKVLDVTDAKFEDFKGRETRKLTRRRYIHDKLNSYVAELRKNHFEVEVYENNLVRLGQQEADMVARLMEQASEPGSKTEQRMEELNRLIGE